MYIIYMYIYICVCVYILLPLELKSHIYTVNFIYAPWGDLKIINEIYISAYWSRVIWSMWNIQQVDKKCLHGGALKLY
jgi:hypothetical protein